MCDSYCWTDLTYVTLVSEDTGKEVKIVKENELPRKWNCQRSEKKRWLMTVVMFFITCPKKVKWYWSSIQPKKDGKERVESKHIQIWHGLLFWWRSQVLMRILCKMLNDDYMYTFQLLEYHMGHMRKRGHRAGWVNMISLRSSQKGVWSPDNRFLKLGLLGWQGRQGWLGWQGQR